MLTINDTHLENDLGLHVLEGSQEPVLPGTRDHTATVPGRHGVYAFDAYIQPRQFNTEILLPTQDSIEDVQELVREFASLLLDEYGQPKEVEIRWDYEPDKYYVAKYSGNIDISRIHHAGTFAIPLTAYDPFAHSIIQADDLTWGNEEITFQSHYLLGHEGADGQTHVTSPTTLTFEVDGYAVKPTIEISGSADGLTLDSGTKSFTLDDFNNSDWVIDGNNYTVTKDNENAFAKMEGDFLLLNRGQNTIEVTGSNLDVNVYVKFRDQYL